MKILKLSRASNGADLSFRLDSIVAWEDRFVFTNDGASGVSVLETHDEITEKILALTRETKENDEVLSNYGAVELKHQYLDKKLLVQLRIEDDEHESTKDKKNKSCIVYLGGVPVIRITDTFRVTRLNFGKETGRIAKELPLRIAPYLFQESNVVFGSSVKWQE